MARNKDKQETSKKAGAPGKPRKKIKFFGNGWFMVAKHQNNRILSVFR